MLVAEVFVSHRLRREVKVVMARKTGGAGRAGTERVRLDERGPGACERIPDEITRLRVALDERLRELGHELAEVGMEAVDVLRALALGKLRLRPRQGEVDLAVQGRLRAHARPEFAAARSRSSMPVYDPPDGGLGRDPPQGASFRGTRRSRARAACRAFQGTHVP